MLWLKKLGKKMERNSIYTKIVILAVLITILFGVVVLLITHDMMFVCSILLGAALSVLGFIWIVLSSKVLLQSTHASPMAMAQYFIRYVIYAIVMYLGMRLGLHVIFMLLGFLSINLAIKLYILVFDKEASM